MTIADIKTSAEIFQQGLSDDPHNYGHDAFIVGALYILKQYDMDLYNAIIDSDANLKKYIKK